MSPEQFISVNIVVSIALANVGSAVVDDPVASDSLGRKAVP